MNKKVFYFLPLINQFYFKKIMNSNKENKEILVEKIKILKEFKYFYIVEVISQDYKYLVLFHKKLLKTDINNLIKNNYNNLYFLLGPSLEELEEEGIKIRILKDILIKE